MRKDMMSLAILGSLMKGRAKRKKREEDRETQKLANEKIKQEIEKQKILADQAQRQMDMQQPVLDLLSQILQRQHGGDINPSTEGSGTPMGKSLVSEPPKQNATEELLQDPGFLLLSKLSGTGDFTNIGNLGLSKNRLAWEQSKTKWIDGMVNGQPAKLEVTMNGRQTGQYQLQPVKPETITEFNKKSGQQESYEVNPYTREPINKPRINKPRQLEAYDFINDEGIKVEGIRDSVTKERVGPLREVDIPKPGSAEQMNKLPLGMVAKQNMPSLKKLMFPDGKNINRKLLMKMKVPGGGIGEGAEFISKWREAVDARVRSATGAAIVETEWPFYESQYLPKIQDTPQLAMDKLNRMERWIDIYLESLDPGGVYRKRIEKGINKEDPLGIR